MVTVVAPAAVTAELAVLRLLETRYGVLTRLVGRVGVSALVFTTSLLVFVASAGGHLYTPDEWTIYAAAAGLVEHGVPAAFADEPYPLHHLSGAVPPAERHADGTFDHAYSKYGVVPTLLAAPLYAIAGLIGNRPELPAAAFPYPNLARPLVPLVLNPAVTAATAALLYASARTLGYARRAPLAAAAAFALGSLAWPFSKTLMNMPLAAGSLLAAFWCVLRSTHLTDPSHVQRRSRRNWLLAAGAMAGLAVATRYETLLFVAPVVALVVWPPSPRTTTAALWFAAGFLAAVVPLVFGMNLLRTGSMLDTGYGSEGTLSTLASKPWYGLFGILLSPGCGLLTHTPLMAIGLLALIWLWEDAPRPALAAGAIALLAIAYYGSLSTWCGYTTWGPRYLVVAGPFLALPLAALWHRLAGARRNPFLWLVAGGIAAWSAGTNLLAVLIDFNRGWQDHWAHDVTYLEVTWLPYFTGITSHLRLLREWLLDGRGGLDLYLGYALGPAGWPVIGGLLLLAAAGATAIFAADEPRSG
jgi:hypothetical protein